MTEAVEKDKFLVQMTPMPPHVKPEDLTETTMGAIHSDVWQSSNKNVINFKLRVIHSKEEGPAPGANAAAA